LADLSVKLGGQSVKLVNLSVKLADLSVKLGGQSVKLVNLSVKSADLGVKLGGQSVEPSGYFAYSGGFFVYLPCQKE